MARRQEVILFGGIDIAKEVYEAFSGQLLRGILTRRILDTASNPANERYSGREAAYKAVEMYTFEGFTEVRTETIDNLQQNVAVVSIFGYSVEGIGRISADNEPRVIRSWTEEWTEEWASDTIVNPSDAVDNVPEVGDFIRMNNDFRDYRLASLLPLDVSKALYEFTTEPRSS